MAQLATHTPGPWEFVKQDKELFIQKNYCGDGVNTVIGEYTLAQVTDNGWLPVVDNKIDGDAEANARLIAAAPDLLEACKRLAHVTTEALSAAFDEADTRDALDDGNAAIAKATRKVR